VRALVDEQLSPQIAVLLRKAGYDVEAVAERDDLVGRSDRTLFEVATIPTDSAQASAGSGRRTTNKSAWSWRSMCR